MYRCVGGVGWPDQTVVMTILAARKGKEEVMWCPVWEMKIDR